MKIKNLLFLLNNKFNKNRQDFLDILFFIEKNNLENYLNDVFIELWSSLKNNHEIVITPILMKLIYKMDKNDISIFIDNIFNHKKRNLIRFLKEKNIYYEEITFKSKKIKNYEYILNDINNTKKTYLLLTIHNFKKLLFSNF